VKTLSPRPSNRVSPLARWLLVPLLLVFFAAWCQNLGLLALTSDEAASGLMADMSMGGIYRQNQDSPHGPVYNLSLRAWRLAAGSLDEFTARLPSVFLGLLLLVLVYQCGRALGLAPQWALAVVVLVGVNPQVVVHLREARPYAPMLVTMTLAALVALRFERLRGAVWLAAGASALALLSHYFVIPFVGALGVWGFVARRGRARWRWVGSQALAWGFLAVWLPLMGRAFFSLNSFKTGKTWSFLAPPWETLARLVGAGAVGYREYPTSWVAWVAGALLVGAWLVACLTAAGRSRWFMVIMVALPLVAYALLCWVRPVFHPKYVLPWVIFASLGVGLAAARWPKLGGAAAAGLLVLMVLPTWRTLQVPYDPGVVNTPDLSPLQRETARELLRLAAPTDVFASGTPDPAHCYYMQHYFAQSMACVLAPLSPTQSDPEFSNQMLQLMSTHRTLWYLDYYNPGWDPEHRADTVLPRDLVSLGTEQVAGRGMRLYTSGQAIQQGQQPLGVRVGQVAKLEGVWQMRAQALHVVLSWRSLAQQPQLEAKVFVHVVDENGQVVTQADGVPMGWARPLSTWTLDEGLLDAYTLDLPSDACASGCALRVGLYDTATAARLPVVDASGARLADDAAVVPLTPWQPAEVQLRH
jgi:hypothetical protein